MFSGEGAREEAAGALVHAVLSRREDHTLRKRAAFKGFEILSRRQPTAPVPDLFIRGAGTYSGTSTPTLRSAPCKASSTRCALRALDRAAADQQQQLQRLDKTLAISGPGSAALRARGAAEAMLARQAQLNAALDLDKSDAEAAEAVADPDLPGAQPNSPPSPIP